MSQEVNNAASNKLAIIHVLAALIKNPLLFANNNYSFSIAPNKILWNCSGKSSIEKL